MIECLFRYSSSRKHLYMPYKTFILRTLKYRCCQCGLTITEWQYDKLYKEIDRLSKERVI